jgi:putative transposase
MLVGHFNNVVKGTFLFSESHSDFDIEVMETGSDHVHFLTGYIRLLPRIICRLRQESTLVMVVASYLAP